VQARGEQESCRPDFAVVVHQLWVHRDLPVEAAGAQDVPSLEDPWAKRGYSACPAMYWCEYGTSPRRAAGPSFLTVRPGAQAVEALKVGRVDRTQVGLLPCFYERLCVHGG
jgi:hypothetical protein